MSTLSLSLSTFRPASLSSRSGGRMSTPIIPQLCNLDDQQNHPSGGGQQPSGNQPRMRSFFTLVAPGVNTAIRRGLFRQVRFLIQFGADVNERDSDGRTPIMHCTLIESEPWAVGLARVLLEKGASIGIRDRNRLNALQYATIYNRPGLVDVFLGAMDFDLNQRDKLGNTALHYAILVGDVVVVEQLVTALRRYQLSVDVANKKGVTPLMQAKRAGNAKCATLLMSQDEDLSVPEANQTEGGMGESRRGGSDGDGNKTVRSLSVTTTQMSDYEENKGTCHKQLDIGSITETASTACSTPLHTRNAMKPSVEIALPSPVNSSTPHTAPTEQRYPTRPASVHVTSVREKLGFNKPLQQRGRRSAWQRREEMVQQKDDPEMDILNQPKNLGHLYHAASESELRNRPEIVFKMNPIECLQQGTSTHPEIPRRRPIRTPPCTIPSTKPPPHPLTSSWRCQMKKLYGEFEFQLTPSYIAGVEPLLLEPEPEADSDDVLSLRPDSVLPSEDMSGSVSDITSISSKRSAGRRTSSVCCTVDAKARRQPLSSKKRQLAALLTLRGDSDASSTETNASSASSRRRKEPSIQSPEVADCSSPISNMSGKHRIGKLVESINTVSKFKVAK